jgi:hypothetical protein
MSDTTTAPVVERELTVRFLVGGAVTARLRVELDPVETARRRAAGQPALCGPNVLGLLDALLTLPHGHAVPERSLGRGIGLALRKAPPGALHRAGGFVTKLAVRPCTPHLATVTVPRGGTFTTAMNRASRFAGYCARQVEARTDPSDIDLYEAEFWGIGVLVDGVTLVEPQEFVRERHTPAWWGFCETVYQQIGETDA